MKEVPGPWESPDSENFDRLYADVRSHGSLANAIQAQLLQLGSGLKVVGFEKTVQNGSPWWANIEQDGRRSELTVALSARLFLCELSECSIQLATANSSDINQLAQMLNAWFVRKVPIVNLQQEFTFVDVDPATLRLYEAGPAAWVEAEWQKLKEYIEMEKRLGSSYVPRQLELVEEISRHPLLGKLHPSLSHDVLHLGRYISGGDSSDYPSIQPTPDKTPAGNVIYQVCDKDGASLGKGVANQVIAILLTALPDDQSAVF